MQCPGEEDLPRFFHQVRDHRILHHRLHLLGRAGHQDGDFTVPLHNEAGGGAIGVGQHSGALWHGGLFQVVFGHAVAQGCKPVFEDGELFLGGDHLPAKVLGHRLLGQVVVGGAKAAGGQNQVTAGERLPQGGFQPFWVVPHHRLMVYFDAHLGQFLRQKRRVGVDDIPQQQLGSNA